MLLSAFWTDKPSSDLVENAATSIVSQTDEAATKMGLNRGFRYANYANYQQRPLESYGDDNINFLRQVAKKYDPSGVFQRQVPGGFKVSQ